MRVLLIGIGIVLISIHTFAQCIENLSLRAEASGPYYQSSYPSQAIDGDTSTAWGFGGYSAAITISLPAISKVNSLRLLSNMTPDGPAHHIISVSGDSMNWSVIVDTSGVFHDVTWYQFANPLSGDSIRYVRVDSPSSVSWISWREIEIWGVDLELLALTSGFIELIDSGPSVWNYRLNHISGSICQFTFTDFCPGTVESVSGDAATAGWTSANYGDSIVFTSTIPMTSGSIQMFTLSHPWCSDQSCWSVGDRTSEVEGPLPVELLSFNALVVDDAVHLSFSTASETDNSNFEIWRSESEDNTFERIAVLPSQGNTASGHTYEYVDNQVIQGRTYWYYLADVDIDGNRTEHREMMVSATITQGTIPTEYSLTAYPNPFNPRTTLEFTLPEAGNAKVLIYDISGRVVSELTDKQYDAGSHKIVFDATNLPSGIYMARFEADEFSMTKKLLLVK